jgi:uncharacterized protein
MKIWIDLDNTPHVPFFRPIVAELTKRGHSVVLTARDAFQVCELADFFGLTYVRVGRHYGKNRLLKVLGLLWRSLQLARFYFKERPAIGLSHGSRSQILLCNLLRVPNVMIMDYEHASTPWLLRPGWEIVPAALAGEVLHCRSDDRIAIYDGIKEDVYANEFVPDSSIVDDLGLSGALVVTVRPPANEAHYHSADSDKLFERVMQRLCSAPGVKVVLIPRNGSQRALLERSWPRWFDNSNVIIPSGPVNGLNLLWHSDLVVSGGGTMNREAAALGVPVYSIFRGPTGAVDKQLEREGRLVLLESVGDVDCKLPLRRRDPVVVGREPVRGASVLHQIVNHVDAIVRAVAIEKIVHTSAGT